MTLLDSLQRAVAAQPGARFNQRTAPGGSAIQRIPPGPGDDDLILEGDGEPSWTLAEGEQAAGIGQQGAVVVTDFGSVLDVLHAIHDFVRIAAERDSPANILEIGRSAQADANGNAVVELHRTRPGYTDRVERLVIQNPGTGTDAFVVKNMPTGFDPLTIGTSVITGLIDYVSSANPASIIDQGSMPVLRQGERLAVVTRGAAPGATVAVLAIIRSSK